MPSDAILPPMPDRDAVTRLLQECGTPESGAAAALLPVVYEQLRAIAQQRMSKERTDHTLQATALVHEAYLRLVGDAEINWDSRGHFFAAAAEAMRRILIEHARARGRVKRGGGEQVRRQLPLNVIDLAEAQDSDEILAVDEAICRLSDMDPRAAQIVRLRFYAGLSNEETAAAMNVSERTVRRDWNVARAWLFAQLRPPAAR